MINARAHGFTLIEVLIFIIVSSLLMSTILIGARATLLNAPMVHKNLVAIETAQRCMEYYLQAIRTNGMTIFGSCNTSITPATQCVVPSGYSLSAYVACTSWNSDGDYQTLTITVSGNGNASLAFQYESYI